MAYQPPSSTQKERTRFAYDIIRKSVIRSLCGNNIHNIGK